MDLYKVAKKINKDCGISPAEFRNGNYKEYINQLLKEKETLIAYYLDHTGLGPDEVELVTQEMEFGQRFYIRKKDKDGIT